MVGLALLAKFAVTAHLAAATIPAQDGRVIVRLVSRQNDISVLSTDQGTRYSATDRHGNVLVSKATLADLKQNHPDIYQKIEPAMCTSIDASVSYSAIAD